MLLQICWVKFTGKEFENNKHPTAKNILPQYRDLSNITEILQDNLTDKAEIKLLIEEHWTNSKLRILLLINNMKGLKTDNLPERRKLNKLILDCIVEVKGSWPRTLVWMKQNIDSEICDIMLSDWAFSGNSLGW